MGMYTELMLAVDLEEDAPEYVVSLLEYMVGYDVGGHPMSFITPKHPLLSTDRWRVMLESDSYYFDGFTHSDIKYDHISRQYQMTIRCNLKNYDSEIEHFLDWVRPYCESEGFVGYMRYEEDDHPTLIYFYEGVEYKTIRGDK